MTSVELCVISHPEMKKPLRCSNSIKVYGSPSLASAQEEAAAARPTEDAGRQPGGSESSASAAKEIEKQQKIRACKNDSETKSMLTCPSVT